MSLISFRNFLAPLSNKLHIGAIIVVAILIAVARLSGAGLSRSGTSEGGTTESRGGDEIDQSIRGFLSDRHDRARLGNQGDDRINQLMRDDGAAKAPTPSNQDDKGALNDIKKSLGLE